MFRSLAHSKKGLIGSVSIILMTLLIAGASHACTSTVELKSEIQYYIYPSVGTNYDDVKMAEYLKTHLQARTPNQILSKNYGPGVRSVEVAISDEFAGDYQVLYTSSGYKLSARTPRIMIWLCYQFIKHVGHMYDSSIAIDDLPPCIFPEKSYTGDMYFEYRDIDMPTNKTQDMTELLCLFNMENDWGLWGHQLGRVLGNPDDGYIQMDPENFAKIGGMTRKDQFCFSSDRLYDLAEQFIVDQYGDSPDYSVNITIGPNDNSLVCQCPRCVAAGNTPTSATPTVVAFVERLANRFPHHQFFIPGYSTTYDLPSHVLPDNVGVFLSAMDYPRVLGKSDSPEAKAFFDRLEQWKKYCKKVYIWDYICNFDDYLTPYPILLVMQERIQKYVEHGVKGLFLNGSGYFYSTLQETYTFILSELMIHPHLNVPKLVNDYFRDAMPHMGNFFAALFNSLERRAADQGKPLPMYGGMDDAINTFLVEDNFRRYYDVLVNAETGEMTHREKVIYEKTKQTVSLSFMEICRYHGIGKLGFADFVDGKLEPNPEFLSALASLKEITEEEDLVILTGNETAAMDHMDRVNESGLYIADYENECALWIKERLWDDNLILNTPITLRRGDIRETTKMLTDAVVGISRNYHWGWQIIPQKNLVIEIPVDKARGAHNIQISFLNFVRHGMAPPNKIDIMVDGKLAGTLKRDISNEYLEDGEKVTFKGRFGMVPNNSLELVFDASNTPNVAIDEVFVTK